MMKQNLLRRSALIAAALLAAAAYNGCTVGVYNESFERRLTVDGPVLLEVESGSGRISITRGTPGTVHVRGEIHEGGVIFLSDQRHIKDLAANPPVQQVGNVIRLGKDHSTWPGGASITYIIETPQDTRVEARAGSGRIEISGIHGPARLTAGSGKIEVENIGDDVTATTGSGGCHISRVDGRVSFTVGSGGATIADVRDEIRGVAHSGALQIERPGGRVSVETGSGGITVRDAKDDLRATAGSGVLDIAGSPSPHSYWELSSGSGHIDLDVPSSASFRLHAVTHSGRVSTDLPIAIEEQSGKELRARVGSGDARVEARTSSGQIRIR